MPTLTTDHEVRTLAHVEALQDGKARLILEGGEVVDVPTVRRASLTPEGEMPRLLIFDTGPLKGAYRVPDGLEMEVLEGLLFPFTVHGFQVREGHMVLTCDRARHVYEVTLPLPAAYTLTGPHHLTFDGQPFQGFEVPADLWPALMPALAGEEKARAPVVRLLSVEVLEGQAHLTLTTGQTLTVSPSATPRASFLADTASGVPVFLEDWQDPTARHVIVPRSKDVAVLAAYFDQDQQ